MGWKQVVNNSGWKQVVNISETAILIMSRLLACYIMIDIWYDKSNTQGPSQIKILFV